MVKVKIAILDDNKVHLDLIKEKVQEHLRDEEIEISTYTTSKELLDSAEKYDILLVDVELQTEREGLRLVSLYRKRNNDAIVMLISSHESMVQEGYEVNAFRYIYKTQLDTELKRGLKAAIDEMKGNMLVDIVMRGNVKSQVKAKDIVMFDKKDEFTEMLLSDGKVIIKNTLKNLEEQLEGKGFVRISKAKLLNIKYISIVTDKHVTLKSGAILDLSRKYNKDVEDAYWNKRLRDR